MNTDKTQNERFEYQALLNGCDIFIAIEESPNENILNGSLLRVTSPVYDSLCERVVVTREDQG